MTNPDDKYNKKGFEIISISCDNPDNLKKVIQEKEIVWSQIAVAQDDEILKEYQVSGLPTYYFINPEGKIIMMTGEFRSKGMMKSIGTCIDQ